MNGTTNGNHSRELPSFDSPSLMLLHPTEAEKDQQTRENGASWQGALPTLEAYARREKHLHSQEATVNGGLTSWVLVDNSDPNKRLAICGCESIRKRALVAHEGIVKDTGAHGIGSVFCPPQYRGRNYASRMMTDLGETLKAWQNEKGNLFSILYSDIGKRFYAKHGWKPFPSTHVSIPASTPKRTSEKLPVASPLHREDLALLCDIDEALLRKRIKTISATNDKVFVTIIPDIQTIRWHHAREEFVGKELYGSTFDIKGAIVGDTVGQRAWCIWTRMWYNADPTETEENTLHILRLVIEEKDVGDWEHVKFDDADRQRYVPMIASLLAAAVERADESVMESVEIWNPNALTLEAAKLVFPKAAIEDRESESICSLRWYGDEKLEDSVVWLGNEKYGWC
ncbi:hypothetical protein BT63DRAFT_480753 [Microthyrium microscopicum]|uniref:LYC1 C-terminal domain-containing protein n=1 Tax=Microthyrium microscopicum TaxID=703497 RepID=A0A6A6UAB3_9PEZI|nr:hypothetical protein BT63DRAFT_480753 [Microthyrium microscopicum]